MQTKGKCAVQFKSPPLFPFTTQKPKAFSLPRHAYVICAWKQVNEHRNNDFPTKQQGLDSDMWKITGCVTRQSRVQADRTEKAVKFELKRWFCVSLRAVQFSLVNVSG
jgi:hypothetical protein